MALKKVTEESIGAVTFLDVLGWKGKWKDGYQSVHALRSLIDVTLKHAEKIHDEIIIKAEGETEKLRGTTTDVLSISDTIVILTKGPAQPTLTIHSRICKEILPLSLKNDVPLRGAIAYGKYSRDGNILIGPAIDEAASWHELTNWIGVNLTPSAKFSLIGKSTPQELIKYTIPFKKKFPSLDLCVDWDYDISEVISLFQKRGPFVPEIAEKYLNTFTFLDNKIVN